MSLDVSNWKSFLVSDIFYIKNGKGITQSEILENPGDLIAVQSGENNNGVMGKIDKEYCKACNYTYTEKPCLTVARSGTAGFVSFQKFGCVVGDSAKILELKNKKYSSEEVLLFLQTLLLANRYKFNYGYKVTAKKYSDIVLKLPVTDNNEPDWQFMEYYIKSLHSKKITTKNKQDNVINIEFVKRKKFILSDILDVEYGNKFDNDKMTYNNPWVNFIGRSAENNGVNDCVDLVSNVEPYKAGCMTIALGGSIGSCFIQEDDFYTAQNVAVLHTENLSKYAKLYLATAIMEECRIKYHAFGRELNRYIKSSFSVGLPACEDGSPDWQIMEDYIRSLPYGDRI